MGEEDINAVRALCGNDEFAFQLAVDIWRALGEGNMKTKVPIIYKAIVGPRK